MVTNSNNKGSEKVQWNVCVSFPRGACEPAGVTHVPFITHTDTKSFLDFDTNGSTVNPWAIEVWIKWVYICKF